MLKVDQYDRALRVLREVRLIAAEDTRHTRKLLTRFQINTPITSYYDYNKKQKLGHVLAELNKGDVALVSDAGTPGLSDPGYLLVRAALDAGHQVSPIPGPSAPIAALVVSGLPTDAFLYLGYLPRKSNERRKAIAWVANQPYTLIWLETPHRLMAALKDLQAELGDRQIAVACELTKMYEEIFRGTLGEAQSHFQDKPPRGEYTLVVAGCPTKKERWSEERLHAAIKDALTRGESPSHLARKLATESGWPRREVYSALTHLQTTSEE